MIDAIKLFGEPIEAPSAARSGDGAGVELVEPITLARAKAHLRVVFNDEDDEIADMITAARVAVEQRLNRTLVQRQLVAAFPTWCALALPKPPFVSVDSVVYRDTDGAEQSLTDYEVYDLETPARVALGYGTAPPALRYRPDAIRVTYTAGYADGDVPAPILSWMLLVIGTLYENRATMITGSSSQEMAGGFVDALLQPYMVYE